MTRKTADCRDFPSESGCTLTISGEEDEVLRAAAEHAVSLHGHTDSPEFRDQLRSTLKNEGGAAAYGTIMRARTKPGRRADFVGLMHEIVPQHIEHGLHSVEVLDVDGDPDGVVVVIHFTDRDSYRRNAERPETDRDYRRQLEYLETAPEWIDFGVAGRIGTAPVG